MKKYFKKYYKLFFIAIIFVILESFCDLMQPSIMSNIVDNGIATKDINYIIREGILMFLDCIINCNTKKRLITINL